jgi:hypothetical protein
MMEDLEIPRRKLLFRYRAIDNFIVNQSDSPQSVKHQFSILLLLHSFIDSFVSCQKSHLFCATFEETVDNLRFGNFKYVYSLFVMIFLNMEMNFGLLLR